VQALAEAAAGASAAIEPAAWPALVARLDIDPPTRMLALHCALLGREGAIMRLALDPRQVSARTKAREDKLAQALSKQLGEPVRLEIEARAAATETPAQAADRVGQEAIAAAHEQLLGDPVVQAIQQRFGATIHPDSVRPLDPR
jgi:DNA polymerase III subunit gamma/tau